MFLEERIQDDDQVYGCTIPAPLLSWRLVHPLHPRYLMASVQVPNEVSQVLTTCQGSLYFPLSSFPANNLQLSNS